MKRIKSGAFENNYGLLAVLCPLLKECAQSSFFRCVDVKLSSDKKFNVLNCICRYSKLDEISTLEKCTSGIDGTGTGVDEVD